MSNHIERLTLDESLIFVGVLAVLSLSVSSVFPAVFFLLVSVFACLLAAHRLNVPARWTLIIFAVPVGVIAADSIVQFMPFFPDARHYRRLGAQILGSVAGNETIQFAKYSLRELVYAAVISGLSALFVESPVSIRLLNTCGFAVGATYWLRIAELEYDRQAAHVMVPLLCVWPGAILYFTATLRESFTFLLLTMAIYYVRQGIANRELTRYLPVVAVITFCQLFFRPELVPLILFALPITLVLTWQNRLALLLLPTPLIGLFGLQYMSRTFAVFPKLFNPLQIRLLEIKRRASATRPRGYLTELSYNSWVDVITTLPVRLFYLLFSPFPWESDSYVMFLPSLDSLYVVGIVGFAIGGALYSVRNDRSRTLLFLSITCLLILTGYSLVASAEGVASRRRLYAIPMLTVFAVRGVQVLGARVRVIP